MHDSAPAAAGAPVPVRTCLLGQGAPVGVAVLPNVGDEAHVLLRRPGALVEPHLGAARCPALPHGCSFRAPSCCCCCTATPLKAPALLLTSVIARDSTTMPRLCQGPVRSCCNRDSGRARRLYTRTHARTHAAPRCRARARVLTAYSPHQPNPPLSSCQLSACCHDGRRESGREPCLCLCLHR
jgi:hypothetical protein